MKVIEGGGDRYFLALEKGDKIVESITRFAEKKKLRGGFVSGIGAITNVEIGYYNLEEKKYQKKKFSQGDYELLSLHGNITQNEGNYFTHVHLTMGSKDYSVIGGHLFEAEVAVVAEIFVTPLGALPKREHNRQVGLNTVCGIV